MPADAGMEDIGSRKAWCSVKKADEIVLAGQAGRKGISRLRVVGLVRKNAWREFSGNCSNSYRQTQTTKKERIKNNGKNTSQYISGVYKGNLFRNENSRVSQKGCK